ncbi:hypothetical protein ACFFRR_005486 [Megaselia abdita]
MIKSENLVLSPLEKIKDKISIQKEQFEFNITPIHNVNEKFETITFGMGCFWGAESLFGATEGVLRTTVGYSGGTSDKPKYTNLYEYMTNMNYYKFINIYILLFYRGDHTEVIKIDFNPSIITFDELLQLFWANHEYGLSTKIKRQYMSVIFYHNNDQRIVSHISKKKEQLKRNSEFITTEIKEASIFYPAEDYHQKYRLQEHKELFDTLNISSTYILHNSYVAAKLNGYLMGVKTVDQFLSQSDLLGLTPTQKEYVKYFIEMNQGRGLFC